MRSPETKSSAKLGGRGRFTFFAIFAALQTTLAWSLLPLTYLNRRKARPETRPRLLILSLGGIGDNVFVLPIFRALRVKYPGHQITLVVRPYVVGIRELIPDCIDQELPYRFGQSTLGRLFEPLRALRFVFKNGLSCDTELALVPRWDWDSWGAVFIAFFSRARRRVTFSEHVNPEKHARNWMHDTFFTHLSLDTSNRHESDYIRSLVQEHEQVEVGPVAGSLRDFPGKVPTHNRKRRIVIGPFAAIARRTWSIARWPQVIRAVSAEDPDLEFTIVGSRGDRELATEIARSSPRTDVQCGQNFRELVRLLSNADLFVGMDSGIAHLAGAAGTPVVQICCHPLGGSAAHNNSPVRFAALSPQTSVLQPAATPGCEEACQADHACCIDNLSAPEIVAAIAAARSRLQAMNYLNSPFSGAYLSQ